MPGCGARRTTTHVPAGAYAFQVIAANRDGVWNTAGQSLRIRVLPPFYGTWWFGLAGMTERVRILGGELSFHSREGQGTTVRVSIELKGKYSGQKSDLSEFRR